jgi:hypothetical protein
MNIIKNRLCFLCCLLLILTVFSKANAQNKEPDMKDALSVIHKRKSVRNFTGEKVSKDDLTTILKAGMAHQLL